MAWWRRDMLPEPMLAHLTDPCVHHYVSMEGLWNNVFIEIYFAGIWSCVPIDPIAVIQHSKWSQRDKAYCLFINIALSVCW